MASGGAARFFRSSGKTTSPIGASRSENPRTRSGISALQVVTVICGLAASVVLPAVADSGDRRPNIVLIMADDLGWRDVSYHDSEIRTPAIDRIAEAGVALDRFYVQPTCSPTRAAVMTGKSPARMGMVRPISKLTSTGLPLSEKILPEIFQEAGYQTLMAGKWHLGHGDRRYFPSERGFEEFYGHVTGGIGYWDHNHGGGHDWQRNGKTLREEGYATRLIADEAVRMLRERDRSRPTFLLASFNAPHLPNEAPEESVDRYPSSLNEKRRLHAGMVEELDTAVERILTTLQGQGMESETLVWFFSDNGGLSPASSPPGAVAFAARLRDWFGDPIPVAFLEFLVEQIEDGASDNGPLRRGKSSVYEGGVRVPSAIWWPGHTAPGVSDAFVTAQDVLPTLLQAAGLEDRIPKDLDGAERWNAILGDETEPPLYLVQGLDGVALFEPPWKLVLPNSPLPFSEPAPELFNVISDPTESSNLAESEPGRVARMRAVENAWPRGPGIHVPIWRIVWDPDRFGGPEDRQPWAEAAR